MAFAVFTGLGAVRGETPSSKSALWGGHVALTETKRNSWATEGSLSTWQVLKGLWFRRLAFGARKMRGKRKNVLLLCPVSTWKQKYRTRELGARWAVIIRMMVFPTRKSFQNILGDPVSWAESSEGQGGRRRQISSPQQSRPQRKRIPNQNAFILTSAPGDLGALLPSEDHGRHVTNRPRWNSIPANTEAMFMETLDRFTSSRHKGTTMIQPWDRTMRTISVLLVCL